MRTAAALLDRRRFLLHWSVNFASLACLAVSGILINSLIAKFYGAAALGVFNQVFAIYIFGSQLAACGVQFSLLRYIAEFGDDRTKIAPILYSALAVTVAAASLVVVLTALFFAVAGAAVYSDAVVAGVMVMLPGLWCFAINKVLLNLLNGLQRNGWFALFTALRYALMSLGAIVAVAVGLPAAHLCVILSTGEGVLLLALAVPCAAATGFARPRIEPGWIRRNAHFGLRSVLGGAAVELNTRVDVLILGLFTSDAVVGTYSFAAFFVEGILQLPQLSRRLVDPTLTRLVLRADRGELGRFIRHGRNLGSVLMATVGIAAIAAYPAFATLFADERMATASWPVFAVLMLGACVFGTYATFSGLFSQASLPGSQSRYNLMILGTNTALNLALAPRFGAIGAAVATAASFIVGTFYFRAMVAKHLAVHV